MICLLYPTKHLDIAFESVLDWLFSNSERVPNTMVFFFFFFLFLDWTYYPFYWENFGVLFIYLFFAEKELLIDEIKAVL